ncbi:hypothetical protein PNA2_0425 [Pyrococcus sp. NA2]|uniref:pantoate kinase n=1 Tax=Pyrococcus sp. (strain NA2) TaxID=342949 RepID=UPI000209A9DE|nr:pantoate kinase [Pyrococcus sp. NA2]AEC51342.1 hypothetical protein PNA2_0425 [Pyrococcus sp. NA2]
MLIRSFIPAHITAFFVPIIREDPQMSGSLGAGVNLSKGTNVFINIEEGLERHIHVAFNGEPMSRKEATITYHVAEKLIQRDFKGEVEIWQYFDFPTGYGFGNSAGGALGTALALAYIFKKTLLEASKIAHEAEVIYRGGLGDVVAQLTGGIDLRIREGGPGVAIVDNILANEYKVFTIMMGKLETKRVLDSEVVERIRKVGRIALENLLRNPTPETLMKEARKFAVETGLMEGELLEIAKEVDKIIRLPSSMIMLGKCIFALIRDDEVEKVKELARDLNVSYDIVDIYWGKPKIGRWIPEE